MRKQQKGRKVKGYKGKTSTKLIIASSVVAGGMLFGLAGYGIKNWMSRDTEVENPYEDIPSYSDTIPTEPPINKPEDIVEPDLDETLPELQEPIIPELDPEETIDELGVEFTEVVALLTQKVRDYIGSVTGVTPDNLNITAVNSIAPDASKGTVTILTQFKNGTKYSNCVVTIANGDTTLPIYNLPADVTEVELAASMKDVLTNENSHTIGEVKQYVKLSNEPEVIKAMLNARLNELNALNSAEADVKDEIAHIKANLEDLSTTRLSLLVNKKTDNENPFVQPFTVTVYAGKYTYSMDMSFEAAKFLSSSAVASEIQECLDNNIDQFKVKSQLSSTINQVLSVVNNPNNIKDNAQELTEEQSKETELSK